MQEHETQVASAPGHGTDHLGAGKMMRFAMLICCAVMVAPLAILVISGDAIGSNGMLSLAIPMAICVGAHLLMHRLMGASCHDSSKVRSDDRASPPVYSETIRQWEGAS